MLYDRLRDNGVPARLLIGPWTHLQASMGPDLPSGSLDELALRWLDRYVRGSRDRSLARDVKPVTYYEIRCRCTWRTSRRTARWTG